jgi:hypothetical protein
VNRRDPRGHGNPLDYLLPYRRQVAQSRAVADAIRETGRSLEEVKPKAVEVDWRYLRGLPAIGRGVAGAIPGTRPGDRLE